MKKFLLFWVLALLCVGFVACSSEDKGIEEGGGEDIEDIDIPVSSFYIVNEGWFGHDTGSVNFFNADGTIEYNVYKTANPGEELGNTTPFAAFWGKYVYFVSKQDNRLVVADSQTFKKKKVFTELGGDGRSFVGVDDKWGYISHTGGIRRFDITSLELGDPVVGINEEIGSLCYANGHVFAVSRKKVYIIDVATNTLNDKELNGSFNTLTQSKDGMIWIASSDGFIRLDPNSLEEKEVAYPQNASVASSWGAWNPGSLCADSKQNILYWTSGNKIIKYNIDTNVADNPFYELGKDGEGKELTFYAAGIRVEPVSGKLIAIVMRKGFLDNFSYNWVHIVKTSGKLEKEIVVKANDGTGNVQAYWFPSMPFFRK